MKHKHNNKYDLDLFTVSYNDYYQCVLTRAFIEKDLNVLLDHYIDDGSSIVIDDNNLIINDLIDINILLDRIVAHNSGGKEHSSKKMETSIQKHPEDQPIYEKFLSLLDDSKEKTNDYSRLTRVLNQKTAFYNLYRERLQKKINIKTRNFTPVCTDDHKYKHSLKILQFYNIHGKNNKVIDWTRLGNHLSNKEMHCFANKIHFLPIIIKNVTDIQLGDCSYLDTCHKFQQNNNSCKYVHYFEYKPKENAIFTKEEAVFIEFEHSQDDVDPLFTFNISNYKKSAKKPTPIECDLRKYDFERLQTENFNAIIADPPWNIHMNLPYGTCNDQELFELPLHKLQAPKINHHYDIFKTEGDCSNRFVYKKGGVMALWVTVRSINLGKQLLVANGYKIINELSWIKINQLCRTIVTGRTGHWLNHSKEHLLLGYKGNVDEWLLLRQQDLDFIVSQTRETSQKPDELYEILERLCGEHSNNLELFGRKNNLRESWVTIGNQL